MKLKQRVKMVNYAQNVKYYSQISHAHKKIKLFAVDSVYFIILVNNSRLEFLFIINEKSCLIMKL